MPDPLRRHRPPADRRPRGPGQVAAWLLGCGLALLAAVAPAQPAPPLAPAGTEACLKLVFNRFCLAGDINALLQREAPAVRLDDGERVALTYYDGPEALYVLGWRGRIYKVVRRYRVASQLRYDELYLILRDKYGPGEDRSRFAASADTAGRRQIAIRRGEGYALHRWNVAGGWRIDLGWTRELGLSLGYVAEALDAAQAAATQGGL